MAFLVFFAATTGAKVVASDSRGISGTRRGSRSSRPPATAGAVAAGVETGGALAGTFAFGLTAGSSDIVGVGTYVARNLALWRGLV